MPTQTRTAHEWASTVVSEQMRLADLDLYVLQPHPHIVKALGREQRPKPFLTWTEIFALVSAVPAGLGVVAVAPVWARQDYSRPWMEPVDFGDNAVVVCAVLFVVALLGPVLSARAWWRSGRRTHWAEVLDLGASLVAGVIAWWLLSRLPGSHATASIVVLVCTAATALVLATMVFASTGRRDDELADFRVVGPADFGKARALVAELSDKKQAWLVSERRRTLSRLRDRGVIDEAQVTQAERLPMGSSITLDPRAVH